MKNYSLPAFIVAIVVTAFLGYALGRYLRANPPVTQVFPDIGGTSGYALGYLVDSQTINSLSVRLTMSGRITGIESDGIKVVKGDSNPVFITLVDDTIFFESLSTPGEQPKIIKKEDFSVGDEVTVTGELRGNELVADTVVKSTTSP